MKPWLSYSFQDPPDTIPEYDGSQLPHTPCAVWWRPNIYSESISIQRGGYYDDLSLPPINIAEIWVESMRAYHLLRQREEMEEFSGIVRILPPKPAECAAISGHGIVCLSQSNEDYSIAAAVASTFNGCVITDGLAGELISVLFQNSALIVFPQLSDSTSGFLSAALCAGCLVVSSDAGAAEEYLTRYAIPGRWHVVHSQKKALYIAAIRDLFNTGSYNPENYMDNAPYHE